MLSYPSRCSPMAEAEDLNPSQCAFESRHRYMKTYRVYANHPIPENQNFVDVEADFCEVLQSGALHFYKDRYVTVRYFGPAGWFTFDEFTPNDSNEPPL